MVNMIIVDDAASAKKLADIVDYNRYSFNLCGCFDNANSALDYIRSEHIDVVICDITLNGTDGINFLKTLYTRYPHIKIIVVTESRDFEYAKAAISYKAFEYITKPVDITQYTGALSKLQEVLKKQEEILFFGDEPVLLLEEVFSDYFNDVTTDEAFIERFLNLKTTSEILHSRCALLELSVKDVDTYLSSVWRHGRERLFFAIKQIIPSSMYNISFFIINTSVDTIQLLAIADRNSDFEKSLTDFNAYISFEFQSLLSLDVVPSTLSISASVFELKKSLPDTLQRFVPNLANLVIAHIENKDFEKISKLRDSFFSTASLAEKQFFCGQLSSAIQKGYLRSPRFVPISPIGLQAISNPNTLLLYFNELIVSHKLQSDYAYRDKTMILDIIRYIDQNFSKSITLESVSTYINLNPSYLSNFFKKQTGECFSTFLVKIRLEHAKVLLRKNPSMKIRAVCEEIGYRSMPYFYRVFQEYTGFSPTEYRSIKN